MGHRTTIAVLVPQSWRLHLVTGADLGQIDDVDEQRIPGSSGGKKLIIQVSPWGIKFINCDNLWPLIVHPQVRSQACYDGFFPNTWSGPFKDEASPKNGRSHQLVCLAGGHFQTCPPTGQSQPSPRLTLLCPKMFTKSPTCPTKSNSGQNMPCFFFATRKWGLYSMPMMFPKNQPVTVSGTNFHSICSCNVFPKTGDR